MPQTFSLPAIAAALGLLLTGMTSAMARSQSEALSIAAKPGLWCNDYDAKRSSCTHILRMTRIGDRVHLQMFFLLREPDIHGSPMKATLQTVAQVREGQFCIRQGDLARSLKVYLPRSLAPVIEAGDQDLGEGVAGKLIARNSNARRLAKEEGETCGDGPLAQSPEFIPSPRADRLVLRSE